MAGFIECDTCRKKLGSPILCDGCNSNRQEIERLRKLVSDALKVARGGDFDIEGYMRIDRELRRGTPEQNETRT